LQSSPKYVAKSGRAEPIGDPVSLGRRVAGFTSIVVEWNKLDPTSTMLTTVSDVGSDNFWVNSRIWEPIPKAWSRSDGRILECPQG
jgi:hypothetical protein